MRRVVVTGLGIVSSIGNNQDEVLDSLRAGRSGITYSEDYAERGFRSQVHGSVKLDVADHVDKKLLRFMGDGAAYNYIAMEQAIADAGLTEAEALRAHRETLSGTDYDFLSYVGWAAGPPTQIAEPGKGGAAFGSEANVLATTRGSLAGGVVPVLQFHGGLEYVDGPTLEMETRLKQALDDGAGLVIVRGVAADADGTEDLAAFASAKCLG